MCVFLNNYFNRDNKIKSLEVIGETANQFNG